MTCCLYNLQAITTRFALRPRIVAGPLPVCASLHTLPLSSSPSQPLSQLQLELRKTTRRTADSTWRFRWTPLMPLSRALGHFEGTDESGDCTETGTGEERGRGRGWGRGRGIAPAPPLGRDWEMDAMASRNGILFG